MRDAEVQRAWLLRLQLPAEARAVSLAALADTGPSSDRDDQGLDTALSELAQGLARALRRSGDAGLGAARAARARRLLFRIQCALGHPGLLMQLPGELHALRLHCKHLRYLLPPEAGAGASLRAAQQALGDWRDLALLERSLIAGAALPRSTALALARRRRLLMPAVENALQDMGQLSEADLS